VTNYSYWEQRFVKRYIQNVRQERYLTFLTNEKRRYKILHRLAHQLDYDRSKATSLHKQYHFSGRLFDLLKDQGISQVCYLMSASSDLDGSELDIETGIWELQGSQFGALLIFPPRPIALYKPEDIGYLILLN
jgi:hypothetical protein